MKYVLMWSTVTKGFDWIPFEDTPADRVRLWNALKTIQGYGAVLLWWRIFREDTGGVFDEITTKGVSGGGVDC